MRKIDKIAKFCLKSYKRGENPLPILRKKTNIEISFQYYGKTNNVGLRKLNKETGHYEEVKKAIFVLLEEKQLKAYPYKKPIAVSIVYKKNSKYIEGFAD